MSERSTNPEHSRRGLSWEDVDALEAFGEMKYRAREQEKLDDEIERQRAQKEALELAQYGIGSTIGACK